MIKPVFLANVDPRDAQLAIGFAPAGTARVAVTFKGMSYPRFHGVLVTWRRPAPGWCRTGPADRC
jgi:hypothetical protein